MNAYERGSLIQLTGTFTNAAGALTNPTNVTCTVQDPAGTVTTPTPTSSSVGVYTATVDLTGAVPGVWNYRFAGTGVCQAAEESAFYVEASAV